MTSDKDFEELVFRQRRISTGVLLLRLAGMRREDKAALVTRAIAAHGGELSGTFAVLTTDKLRIRRQSI